MDRETLHEQYPHIDVCWLPHPNLYRSFAEYVDWELGCGDVGDFMGWCPLHDKKKKAPNGSAEFNFHKGIMRCQGEPSCSEPKRAMSLNNVTARMLDGR